MKPMKYTHILPLRHDTAQISVCYQWQPAHGGKRKGKDGGIGEGGNKVYFLANSFLKSLLDSFSPVPAGDSSGSAPS